MKRFPLYIIGIFSLSMASCQLSPEAQSITLSEIPRVDNNVGVKFFQQPNSLSQEEGMALFFKGIPEEGLSFIKPLLEDQNNSLATVHENTVSWLDEYPGTTQEKLFLEVFTSTRILDHFMPTEVLDESHEASIIKHHFEVLLEHTPQQIDLLFPTLVTLEGIYTSEEVRDYGQTILDGVAEQTKKNAAMADVDRLGKLVENIPTNGENKMTQSANAASDQRLEITNKQATMLSKWLTRP